MHPYIYHTIIHKEEEEEEEHQEPYLLHPNPIRSDTIFNIIIPILPIHLSLSTFGSIGQDLMVVGTPIPILPGLNTLLSSVRRGRPWLMRVF